MTPMLDTDLLRSHQERLLLSVQSAFSAHTGMLHCSTSWHPHEKGELLPLAENFAFALILCRAKSTESVLQARALLNRLLKWQRGLFPKYLHELDQGVCEHSSRRICLVLCALLKWHLLAVGDLAGPLRELLADLERQLKERTRNRHLQLSLEATASDLRAPDLLAPEPTAPELTAPEPTAPEPTALYHSPDLFDLFQFHIVGGALAPSLAKRVALATSPWGEPCWLEKPLPSLFKSDTLLELFQSLQMGKLPASMGIAQIWSCLIHDGGQLLPAREPEGGDSYAVYRSFQPAAQKRFLPSSCALHLKNERGGQLLLLCEKAGVSVERLGRHLEVHIFDRSIGNGDATGSSEPKDNSSRTTLHERQPLFMIATDQVKGWSIHNSSGQLASSNFFSSEQLLAGAALEHLVHGWNIELTEVNGIGHFHQHPWRGAQESLEEPFKRRLLVYTPIKAGRESVVRLRISMR